MTERMAALADAAIHLVATRGMRGLTHRAVDAEAGVPTGSTSAYFRTRKALVEGVVRRLAELDAAEVAEAGVTRSLDPDELAEGVARVLDTWMTTGRERTLARYACLLEATHHPELRGVLVHGERLREQARELLTALGAPAPERQSRELVAFIDGLLFDRLVGTGALGAPAPGTPESRAELALALRAALRGVLGR
ncbi:TetR/AcrR family transcriptional regulator [Saccharothrix longispora]|uniref:TetR/AcrR family transcriptional regulator n=1 Tax=Saccharothrix longispora TaxID=33920 RepID=UPI0028FD1157|nr:TetR family transcriptional regulator [Saccharothrix longispora]MBY8850368.1 TetR family transcriptional regulator [Saccharothrix sp. MB29]MDU0293109.1 TetR family transcriptional regulator [Saccharothrix longispora]